MSATPRNNIASGSVVTGISTNESIQISNASSTRLVLLDHDGSDDLVAIGRMIAMAKTLNQLVT